MLKKSCYFIVLLCLISLTACVNTLNKNIMRFYGTSTELLAANRAQVHKVYLSTRVVMPQHLVYRYPTSIDAGKTARNFALGMAISSVSAIASAGLGSRTAMLYIGNTAHKSVYKKYVTNKRAMTHMESELKKHNIRISEKLISEARKQFKNDKRIHLTTRKNKADATLVLQVLHYGFVPNTSTDETLRTYLILQASLVRHKKIIWRSATFSYLVTTKAQHKGFNDIDTNYHVASRLLSKVSGKAVKNMLTALNAKHKSTRFRQ